MDGMENKYVFRLLEISGKKLEYLEGMLALTKEQAGSITEDGIDVLQGIIDKKQKLIDEITKLDDEYNVYFQRFKSSMKISKLSELDASRIEGAAELKAVTAKILDTLGNIEGLERENSIKAQNLLNSFSRELKKIYAGRKLTGSYIKKQLNQPSFFIDKKK